MGIDESSWARDWLRQDWERRLAAPLEGVPGWYHDCDHWFDERWGAEQWRLVEQTPSVHWELLYGLKHGWQPMIRSRFRLQTEAASVLDFHLRHRSGTPAQEKAASYDLLLRLRPQLPAGTVVTGVTPFSLELWTAKPASRDELAELAERLFPVARESCLGCTLRAVFYGSDQRNLVFYAHRHGYRYGLLVTASGVFVTAAAWHAQNTDFLSRVGVRECALPQFAASSAAWTVALLEPDPDTLRALGPSIARDACGAVCWEIQERTRAGWTLFEVKPDLPQIGLLRSGPVTVVQAQVRELATTLTAGSYAVNFDRRGLEEVLAPGELCFRYACAEGEAENFDEQVNMLRPRLGV